MKISRILLMLAMAVSCNAAYGQLRVESKEDALRRQIEQEKLRRQLDDIRNGRVPTDYGENNNPHVMFITEIHQCAGGGYHNTSSEPHCFDMYFDQFGNVYWNRRKYARAYYNDTLSGTYYLQENGYDRYDLHITWNNGSKMKGYVKYNGTNKPRIHIDNYVFEGK